MVSVRARPARKKTANIYDVNTLLTRVWQHCYYSETDQLVRTVHSRLTIS